MELGIFAKTFQRSSPRACLEAVHQHGMQVAHYNMVCSGLPAMPGTIPLDVAGTVKVSSVQANVELVGISGTYNMIHPDENRRLQGLQRLSVLAKAAQIMGIPAITVCTGTRDPEDKWRGHPDNHRPEAWRDLCANMEQVLDIADTYNLVIGIEPETANVVDTPAKALQLIDEMKSPRLRIVFDPANLFEVATLQEQRRLINEGLDLLAERLIMAHAKDRKADGTFCAAGRGVLDYPFFLDVLKTHGFNGPLILHGLEEQEVPGCVKFLEEVVGEVG